MCSLDLSTQRSRSLPFLADRHDPFPAQVISSHQETCDPHGIIFLCLPSWWMTWASSSTWKPSILASPVSDAGSITIHNQAHLITSNGFQNRTLFFKGTALGEDPSPLPGGILGVPLSFDSKELGVLLVWVIDRHGVEAFQISMLFLLLQNVAFLRTTKV